MGNSKAAPREKKISRGSETSRIQAECREKEKKLLQERREWENIFQAIGHPSIILDRQHRILAVNRHAVERLGIPEERILGRPCHEVFHKKNTPPEDCPLMTLQDRCFEGTVTMEIEALGGIFLISCTPVGENGDQIEKYINVATEITDWKKAEAELRNREALLQSIFRAVPAGIGLTRDRIIKHVNQRLCDMTGYSQKELIGESARILYPSKAEFERVGRDKYAKLEKYGVGSVETVWKHRDGRTFDIMLSSSPLEPADPSSGITFSAIDITTNKRAREALDLSRERYQAIFEGAGEGIIYCNRKGIILDVNPALTKITGLPREKFLNVSLFQAARQFLSAQDAVGIRGMLRDLLAGKPMPPHEINYKNRILEISADFKKASQGITGIVRDITESRRARDRIDATLKEKEVLLREIQHRVKNNLQIISSLLRLQTREIQDPEARSKFQASQNRIRSMALIHERLYQSEDYSRIDFGEYMGRMITHLASVYSAPSKRIRIQMDLSPGTLLDVNRAIPCGLIVNELVSNALRHAFPDQQGGVIGVFLETGKKGKILIRVEDDGIGLPPDLDPEKAQTLGIQLLADLVRQINGSLRLERAGGTAVTIEF